MTNDPIEQLEALDERWPNLFEVWKAMNGHDVPGIGYEGLMAVNMKMMEHPVVSQHSTGPISRPGPADGARFRARRWRSSTLVSVTSPSALRPITCFM